MQIFVRRAREVGEVAAGRKQIKCPIVAGVVLPGTGVISLSGMLGIGEGVLQSNKMEWVFSGQKM